MAKKRRRRRAIKFMPELGEIILTTHKFAWANGEILFENDRYHCKDATGKECDFLSIGAAQHWLDCRNVVNKGH